MSPGPGTIRNSAGERIDYTFTSGAAGRQAAVPASVVVIAHGVTAHKDRPWLVALADGLAGAGIASLRLSYAGNGASEGRFEDAVPSKEVGDLRAVVDAIEAWGVGRIAYVGHSMGGAVGVMAAATDPRIAVLVSLAGMVHVRQFFETHFAHLAPGAPMLDKPECPWSPALLEDARRIDTVLPQAAAVAVPWLLVHGDADELVPYQDSLDARAAAGGRPELVTLEGIDHRFTGVVARLVEAVVPWIGARL